MRKYRNLILLLPTFLLANCFSASKEAIEDVTKKSLSVCPFNDKVNFRVTKPDGKDFGIVKISNTSGKIKGSKNCFLSGAKNLGNDLGTDLNSFFSREYYKLPNGLYFGHISPLTDKNTLYILENDKVGNWRIYGTCKKNGADCANAMNANELINLSQEIKNQTPSYILEVVK